MYLQKPDSTISLFSVLILRMFIKNVSLYKNNLDTIQNDDLLSPQQSWFHIRY